MIQNHSDELWDIYTKDRAATGEMHQRRNRMKAGEYHIVVHICIFNHKNQLLIQQRQPFKKGWPNMWDLSVGGRKRDCGGARHPHRFLGDAPAFYHQFRRRI